MKKSGRYSSGKPLKIWRNNNGREKLKSQKATLLGGNCCWQVIGTRNQTVTINYSNYEEQLNFYVKELKAHKCT